MFQFWEHSHVIIHSKPFFSYISVQHDVASFKQKKRRIENQMEVRCTYKAFLYKQETIETASPEWLKIQKVASKVIGVLCRRSSIEYMILFNGYGGAVI